MDTITCNAAASDWQLYVDPHSNLYSQQEQEQKQKQEPEQPKSQVKFREIEPESQVKSRKINPQ